jgi:hypothetical protein
LPCVTLQASAQEALGLPHAVDFGGVEEVDVCVNERAKGLECGIVVFPLLPSIGTSPDRGDLYSRGAEKAVLALWHHGFSLASVIEMDFLMMMEEVRPPPAPMAVNTNRDSGVK